MPYIALYRLSTYPGPVVQSTLGRRALKNCRRPGVFQASPGQKSSQGLVILANVSESDYFKYHPSQCQSSIAKSKL